MAPYDPAQPSPLQKRIARHRAESMGEAWDEPSGYSAYDKWNDEQSAMAGMGGFDPHWVMCPYACWYHNPIGWLFWHLLRWFR